MRHIKDSQYGYTTVELLIVIIVLAVSGAGIFFLYLIARALMKYIGS